MPEVRIKHEVVPGNDLGFCDIETDDYPHDYELYETEAVEPVKPVKAQKVQAEPATPPEPPETPPPASPEAQAALGWAKPEGA